MGGGTKGSEWGTPEGHNRRANQKAITDPLPHCMLGYTPSVNRMTDTCKNITLPQTSLSGSKYCE